MTFVEEKSWSSVEMAYVIGRRVGTAVTRNRLRRRLRALVAERASDLAPGAYVVRAGPEAAALDFDELGMAMGRALERAMMGRSDRRSPTAAAPTGRAR